MTCCADAGLASADSNDKATAPSKTVGLVIAVSLVSCLRLTAMGRKGSITPGGWIDRAWLASICVAADQGAAMPKAKGATKAAGPAHAKAQTVTIS